MPKVAAFKERVRTAFLRFGELTPKMMSDLVGGGYPPDVVWSLRKCGLKMQKVRHESGATTYRLLDEPTEPPVRR